MNDLKHKILKAVEADLRAIETALVDHLNPCFELVRRIAGHILFAGGKRLRPLLMVQTARLCGYAGDEAAKYAVLFEYLHTATLLHDDLVDGGRQRRGTTAAHRQWNPPKAVLTGDFLLARALSLAAETRSLDVIDTIASITEQMSQGEIEQLARIGDLTLDEDQYLELIRLKTAVLFQGVCRTGALLSSAPAKQVRALEEYGHHLGMAFQMADDLLDYTSDSEALGKKTGTDLREGKLTLPIIYALRRGSRDELHRDELHRDELHRDELQWMVGLIRAREFTSGQFQRLIKLLDNCGAIDYTRRSAQTHVDEAIDAIRFFDEGDSKELLVDIARYALTRTA